MKPLLLKVAERPADSIDIRYERQPHFDNPWHYHPELELTLITKSRGIRFVGDAIEPFEEGDLVLLGASLPHYWRNDARYYAPDSTESAEAIILRFRATAWGNEFLTAPEMQPLNELFHRANRGLHFGLAVAEEIRPLLRRLLAAEGLERMVRWLQVFAVLVLTNDYRILSQKAFGGTNPTEDSSRIGKVLAYIQQHLQEAIRLDQVATVAHMNPAAFCRYFKQQTNKTFVEVLNEFRINYACRLLLDSDKDVGQVCFDCGFRNVSHFNQVFKAHKGISPLSFRKGLTKP